MLSDAPYSELSPETVLDAIEAVGHRCDGRVLALNSYENAYAEYYRAYCDSILADANGEDFHLALAQACRHYINELNDEQQDERRLIP